MGSEETRRTENGRSVRIALASALVVALAAPSSAVRVPGGGTCGSKPCWRVAGAGCRYRNRTATPDGVAALKLRASGGGELSVQLKAKGANLRLPSLDLGMPVTVQLLVGDADAPECWQAVFTSALRHDGVVFRATQP